jgi:hypothetical protein
LRNDGTEPLLCELSISEEARESFSPAVDIFAVEIFISTDGRNLSVNQPLRELRALRGEQSKSLNTIDTNGASSIRYVKRIRGGL